MSEQAQDTNPVREEDPAANEIVEITDLNQFCAALMKWHSHKVAMLKHLADIPDGASVSIDGAADIVLTGDVKSAFTLGISMSLMELGTLPFFSEVSEKAEANEQGTTG